MSESDYQAPRAEDLPVLGLLVIALVVVLFVGGAALAQWRRQADERDARTYDRLYSAAMQGQFRLYQAGVTDTGYFYLDDEIKVKK